MELKWGQGAKCIGGEIKVDTLERALELQKRGYLVTPDPSDPAIQAAFTDGAIRQFERHSRLGFVDEEGFYAEVQRLRDLGAKRVTLKTGAYPMRELAMAIKWASNAKIDLLTIDGAPGGTGMSPWRMMEEWGVPTFYLQCMANELAEKLARQGAFVPDIAIAGGFSTEDHVFKVLALGAPHTKAVCMGRALMIPGFVGKNIEHLDEGAGPAQVRLARSARPRRRSSSPTRRSRPSTAPRSTSSRSARIGIYTYSDKIKVGLQQLMSGSRNMRLDTISRSDLMALTREAAEISGIPFVMDAYRDEAMRIIEG